jgi:glutathione synthase/RimK-type ligase-like ATP-grasp enzyme
MRVVLASCKVLPEPDPDEALLVEALRAAGVDAEVLAWDDDDAPFARADLVVLRSTWNYYADVGAFLAWVERTAGATRLLNPAGIVAANVRKTYLRDLAARGVDVVPTEFVRAGERCDVARLMDDRGMSRVVVKPVVSAGSFRTESFTRERARAAQTFLDDLVRDRDAMVQRWMPAVETYGERSLVWIDGRITHAVRKSPRFAGGVEQVSGAMPIEDRERAFAEEVLAPWADSLLYGRVDIIRDEDDVLRVMEVELVEPSLFLTQSPAALDRFVRAIVRRAG